jgi:hypothetical protein
MSAKEKAAAPVYVNAWTHNLRRRKAGYIIHAVECGKFATLCGLSKIQEHGALVVSDECEPDCIRCRTILRKRGVLKD